MLCLHTFDGVDEAQKIVELRALHQVLVGLPGGAVERDGNAREACVDKGVEAVEVEQLAVGGEFDGGDALPAAFGHKCFEVGRERGFGRAAELQFESAAEKSAAHGREAFSREFRQRARPVAGVGKRAHLAANVAGHHRVEVHADIAHSRQMGAQE